MFQLNLGTTPNTLTPKQFKELADRCDGYSGSDVSVLVRDALMAPVRKVQSATHFKQIQAPDRKNSAVMRTYLTPCSPGDQGAREMNWMDVNGDDLMEPPVTFNDFINGMARAKPSVSAADLEQHVKFTNDFGQEG